ncbi:MAG: hypothetical protein II412_02460, partial [Clostridia bacterium]|nr:hypothetical protein [Clostridia bacterium]
HPRRVREPCHGAVCDRRRDQEEKGVSNFSSGTFRKEVPFCVAQSFPRMDELRLRRMGMRCSDKRITKMYIFPLFGSEEACYT